MRYMISDGRKYLHRDSMGNYVPVKKAVGDIWDQRSKAKNILLNSVGKQIRSRYRVVEIEDAITTEYNVKKKSETIQGSVEEISNCVEQFVGLVEDLNHKKEKMLLALSDIDQEINDINHYIEFGTFNAYQGWLAFNMLRDRLKKRRDIKDKVFILTQLNDCRLDINAMIHMRDTVQALDDRTYQPRKLFELFGLSGDGILNDD